MDNNWCGAEDGRAADREDWENFCKEVKSEIVSAFKENRFITCKTIKEKIGATDINDVYRAAKKAGFTLNML